MDSNFPQDLLDLKNRIDNWHLTRRFVREALPAELREAIIQMLSRHPVSVIKKALKLDPYRFRTSSVNTSSAARPATVSDHVKLSKFGHRRSRPPTSHRSNPPPQASQLMPQTAHIIHWDSIPPYLRQYRYEIVERSDWSKRWQRRISKPPPRYRQHERSLDLVHCHLLIVPGPNQLSI